MKTLIILLLALAVALPMAMADQPQDTSQAQWNKDLGPCGNRIRECLLGHDHAYQRYTPDYQAGVGVDLIVFKHKQEEKDSLLKKLMPNRVTVEQKYDIANDVHSTFLVSTYDLYDLWQNR